MPSWDSLTLRKQPPASIARWQAVRLQRESDSIDMEPDAKPQIILVCQQNGSAEAKIAGIRRYGGDRFQIKTHDIDDPLPELIDDTTAYLPARLEADLILDFLKHPDLSTDLARMAHDRGIPVVASGKKIPDALTPPT